MEFVEGACPLSQVGDIPGLFRRQFPDETQPMGVRAEVIETYVRSCAGYCVITYLLGIGDRHLDNIMLRPTGHLFHIDFGYIFGRDPKWNPPPVRLTKEMVVGMGGPTSQNYYRFKSYCCQAYNVLRKSGNLILNLLTLSLDANIGSIAPGDLDKVKDRFQLALSDEEAERVLIGAVDYSLSAIWPSVIELGHRIATALK